MDLLLLDHREAPVQTIEAWNVVRQREFGGFDILNFNTDFRGLLKGWRVVIQMPTLDWQEFIVSRIVETRERVEVSCEHSIYDTFGEYIPDRMPSGTADVCLDVALEYSRWERLNALALGDAYDLSLYRCSVREALSMIADYFNVIFRTKVVVEGSAVTHRYIWLTTTDGVNKGYRYESGYNATDISRTVDSSAIVNCMYGYGRGIYYEETGGYGPRIDFAAINGGVPYVENTVSVAIFGRQIFGKVEYDDTEDPAVVLERTTRALEANCFPKITYSGNVFDFNIGDSVDVGEKILLIDEPLGVRVEGKVLSIGEYLDKSKPNKIKIGNFNSEHPDITQARVTQTLRDIVSTDPTRGGLESAVSAQVNNLLSNFNNKITEGMLNGTVTALPGGFIFESESYAMHIGPEGLRIANTKNPDGTWIFTTFATGDGLGADVVGADQIIAGSISSDHITTTGLNANVINVTGGYDLDTYVTQIRNDQISLAQTIGDLKAGNSNLLMNTEFGASASPSDYWWVIQNETTWGLLAARYDTWAELQGRSLTWNGLKTYNW